MLADIHACFMMAAPTAAQWVATAGLGPPHVVIINGKPKSKLFTFS